MVDVVRISDIRTAIRILESPTAVGYLGHSPWPPRHYHDVHRMWPSSSANVDPRSGMVVNGKNAVLRARPGGDAE